MKNTFSIRPLRLGTIKRKKENMAYKCGVNDIMDFPLISFYLEGASHKIIVDTGGSAPDSQRWQPYFRSKNENLEQALLNISISPEDIDLVILTHLHWDHAGNNHLFPNANFIVQMKEFDYLLSPKTKVKAGFELDIIMKTKYVLVDGDCEIIPGISVILTPGHTTGMQCIVVNTEMGKYILGGDLITLFENWEAVPHVPNGGHYDLDVMMRSLEIVDKLNA